MIGIHDLFTWASKRAGHSSRHRQSKPVSSVVKPCSCHRCHCHVRLSPCVTNSRRHRRSPHDCRGIRLPIGTLLVLRSLAQGPRPPPVPANSTCSATTPAGTTTAAATTLTKHLPFPPSRWDCRPFRPSQLLQWREHPPTDIALVSCCFVPVRTAVPLHWASRVWFAARQGEARQPAQRQAKRAQASGVVLRYKLKNTRDKRDIGGPSFHTRSSEEDGGQGWVQYESETDICDGWI